MAWLGLIGFPKWEHPIHLSHHVKPGNGSISLTEEKKLRFPREGDNLSPCIKYKEFLNAGDPTVQCEHYAIYHSRSLSTRQITSTQPKMGSKHWNLFPDDFLKQGCDGLYYPVMNHRRLAISLSS